MSKTHIKRFGVAALALIGLLSTSHASYAQPPNVSYTVGVCDPKFAQRCVKPNADGSVNVSGSISSTQAAFAPTGQAPLAVTSTSARVALASVGPTAVVQNLGSTTSYVLFGNGSVVATTSTGYPITAGGTVAFNVGSSTNIAAITASGTSTLSITTGTGVPAVAGAGSGTSGGASATAAANGTVVVTAGTNKPQAIDLFSSLSVQIKDASGNAFDLSAPAPIAGADGLTVMSNSNPVAVNDAGGSLTIDGIVTANLGTIGGVATEASLVKLPVAQGSTTSGQSGPIVQCAVTTAAPTYTTAQTNPLSCDTTGTLRVSAGGVAQGSTTSGQSGSLIQGAVTTANPTYTTAQTSPLSLTTAGDLRVGQATAANLNATIVGSGPVSNGTAQAGSELIGCVFTTTAPTLTTTQQSAVQCNNRGVPLVAISDGATTVSPGNGNGDARSSATAALPVGSNTYGFNSAGNTWDRARTANNSLNTTGTGVMSAQVVGQCDDTSPTALTENSFGNVRMSCTNHALVTRPYETQTNTWIFAIATGGITNTTTAVTIKAADAANRNCITSLQLAAAALGAATEFAVRDGAGGTVLWRTFLGTAGLPSTAVIFPSPICGTANTLMEVVTLTASITGSVYADAQGYVAP